MDLFISGLLIILIPGIYFAYKKNFFVIFSRKYNIFPIQLILTIPIFAALSFVLSIFAYLILIILIPSFVESAVNQFGENVGLLLPIIADIVIIITFNKYIIENEKFDIPESQEYEIFVYFPLRPYWNFGGKLHGTKFSYPKRIKKELIHGFQETNLIIDYNLIEGIDFAFTFNGEIIASEKALKILNENDLTGIQKRAVQNSKKDDVNINYYQLISMPTMPEMAPKTKFVYELWINASKIIVNNKIYYNREVLQKMLDFNQSFEVLGYEGDIPYPPQKYWIVSKKARSILINELNQHDYDFIPIHLIDDEK